MSRTVGNFCCKKTSFNLCAHSKMCVFNKQKRRQRGAELFLLSAM